MPEGKANRPPRYSTFAEFADAAADAHYGATPTPVRPVSGRAVREGILSDELIGSLARALMEPAAGKLALNFDPAPLVLLESTREQWVSNRGRDVDQRSLARLVPLDVSALAQELHAVATEARALKAFCAGLSLRTSKPVVVVFNARGGTPYSWAFCNACHDPSHRLNRSGAERPFSDVRCLTHVKISSHEYVRTEAEAAHLSGSAPWRQKVRKSYEITPDGAIEEAETTLLTTLEEGLPLVFIDVPTWGVGFSSSAGLDRKVRDHEKWRLGVRRPYKWKSYVDFAGYRTVALSAPKMRLLDHDSFGDQFFADEEFCGGIDYSRRVGFVINPRRRTDTPLWDNSPHLLGDVGLRYSPLRSDTSFSWVDERNAPRGAPARVITHVDGMATDLDAYLRGATLAASDPCSCGHTHPQES